MVKEVALMKGLKAMGSLLIAATFANSLIFLMAEDAENNLSKTEYQRPW